MDIYFLEHEIEASDMSAVQAVFAVDKERAKLEKEAEALLDQVRSRGDQCKTSRSAVTRDEPPVCALSLVVQWA